MAKKILITGAGSGFGLGAAIELARRGHHVVGTAESWPQVRSLRSHAAEAGVDLEVIKLNLLDDMDIAHAATYEPDVLVLNSGIMESGSVIDIPIERVRESFEVNVFAHIKLVQGIVPKMVARKYGKVVWLSSMGGIMALPFIGAYCATKHAIEAIAGAMKTELEPYGIKVSTVNPGMYATGFNDTGAESHVQWYDEKTAVVPMPGFDDALSGQNDPKEMIDAMVEIITAENHLYRTMLPSETIDAAKKWQETEWTQSA
ncbi:TPA: SDR family oxidoreductase [Pseudomonas aeruginosa]|uniref:SDR family oxidoreductase n=1 Tax=Pseudomonas aeruginosa TaxID=287 RepID=UPI00053EA958|nr:SDR family oxidoreductase [Pseudomonas aeruginosa]EIU5457914.1 SDR family oxidoreductase [Pseudomonas aeruginosa]EIU5538918.1 SDR family oxidoreductase [Pseudomonas aeruginosa]EKY0072526.1 SDR family oxidoreductase [Pseudomonas aeruginosa]EKY0497983.1 SDR family oxidoreductase [Pseudomonas aeruginosa]EKY1844870.1 SDR family oxidoreductase [Pseudomonas aeruginosa]